MKINSPNLLFCIQKRENNFSNPIMKNYSNLSKLNCDTVSFSSKQKSFEQINFADKFSCSNLETVNQISKFAEQNNANIYLVGGIVRDMLLGEEASDIDFLVEDNAVEFTKKLCEMYPTYKVEHLNEDFGTARINVNGEEIDIASTRTEKYEKKGIPIVSSLGCPISKDIKRRDFTINAMALKLNHDRNGRLQFIPVDITNGLDDLNTKTLRTTYKTSFEDDPTRIIRGLKFRLKYGMHYDKTTQEMQNKLLANPKREEFSEARIKSTMRKLFEDEKLQVRAFESVIEEGIFKLFTAETNAQVCWAERIKEASEIFNVKDVARVCIKLLDNDVTTPIIDGYDDSKILANSDIYQAMKDKSNEDLAIYYVVTQDENAIKFYNDLKYRKPLSNGKTLIALGLKPSKEFNKILKELQTVKLNRDDINTQEDEIEFIKSYLNML